jgi:hypothetical protein
LSAAAFPSAKRGPARATRGARKYIKQETPHEADGGGREAR